MIGLLKDVGIEALTATVAKNCVPVEEVLKDLMSEKKAKRLAHGTGIEALSIAPPEICALTVRKGCSPKLTKVKSVRSSLSRRRQTI